MIRDLQMGVVSEDKIRKLMERKQMSREEAERTAERGFEQVMRLRGDDPYTYGYEPPIWYVAGALLQDTVVTDRMRKEVKRKTGLEWEAFATKMQEACGFDHPVREILIMGSNRSGKTDFACKYCDRTMYARPNSAIAIGAQTNSSSVETQQKRAYNYLQKETKAQNGRRERVFWCSYSQAGGFSKKQVIVDNGSGIRFLSYKQDRLAVLEGQAYHLIYLDEEFGVDWLQAARGRLASTGGTLILGFTPVSGYTPVVASFLDGAVVTRKTVAYMLPQDGGEPLPHLQLGLTEEEYAIREAYSDGVREDCPVPESRPENCFEWLNTPAGSDPESEAEGRIFKLLPRVARTKDGTGAILWFLGRDNPYGRPYEVIVGNAHARNAREMIIRRVYGQAEQLAGRRFPNFRKDVHVVSPDRIPEKLARTFSCDPANERNWFFLWCGTDSAGNVWVYREWPGNYEIPGVGVPGPWAEVSDKNNGINDGARGEGQQKFGFGLDQYKFEWARLEGWEDYLCWSDASGGTPSAEELECWSRHNGSREPLRRRVIDGRAGAQSKIGAHEDMTLIDRCCELDADWELASGAQITTGEQIINSLLNPMPGGAKLFISEDCRNLIFSLSYYTGKDGQKGACKESLDCLRYALESGMLLDRPNDSDAAGSDSADGSAAETEDLCEIDIDYR